MTYEDRRSPEQHDRDRVLYSSAFRRLGGVTQVVAVHEKQLLHNRLTHTMKVAQLARRLAEALCDDPGNAATLATVRPNADVAETAALSHDIGHPPFGHIAEEELHRLCQREGLDGFNGNAQSFRIVTKLSSRNSPDPGLGLTRASLNGILKYPWLREDAHVGDKKFGAYQSEREVFEDARQGLPPEVRTIEAEIMDWSDDVAYATHDLEDFYRAGLIPLERVTTDTIEGKRFLTKASAALASDPDYDPDLGAQAFEDLRLFISPDLAFRATRRSRTALHRQTNQLITRYMAAVKLHKEPRFMNVSADIRHEVMILKQLTWQYVVNSPALAMAQQGQRRVVRIVFRGLLDWIDAETRGGSLHRLPSRLHGYLEDLRNDAPAMTEVGKQVEKLARTRVAEAEAQAKAASQANDDEAIRSAKQRVEHEKAVAADAAIVGVDRAVRARAVSDYITSLTEDQIFDLHEKLSGFSRSSIFEGWVNA